MTSGNSEKQIAPPGKAAASFFALASFALIAWIAGPILDVLLLAFAGALLAVSLRGLGTWLSRPLKVNSSWGTAAACAILVLIGAGVIVLAAPDIAEQASDLSRALPEAIEEVGSWLEGRAWGNNILDWLRDLGGVAGDARTLTRAGGLLSTTFGALAAFIVFMFVGLFLAFDPEPYRNGLLRLVPLTRRARAGAVLDELGGVLRHWIAGKVLAMLVVGATTWLGLALLGIPLGLVLALLAALLTFIPNFGPVISAVPAVLLGLVESPLKALYVVALYVGVQTVESYLLTPMVQKRTVSLPPALTILTQVLMATLAGGLGVVVATPLTAAIVTTLKMVYVEDTLGDRESSGDTS